MFKRLKQDESGLTLIELTIVIVILGILAAFIAPRIIDAPQKAKVSKAQLEIGALKTALQMYYIQVGQFPTTEQGLDALYRIPNPPPPNWSSRFVEDPIPNDPWGNPYIYLSPSNRTGSDYDLMSYGRDGKLGGDGFDTDIKSWVEETTN